MRFTMFRGLDWQRKKRLAYRNYMIEVKLRTVKKVNNTIRQIHHEAESVATMTHGSDNLGRSHPKTP
jgi:hypothetical protein